MEKLDFINKYGGLINTTSKNKGKRSQEDQLEMFHYLNEQYYEINKQAKESNDEVLKQMAGAVGGSMIAEITKGIVVPEKYDVIVLQKNILKNGITLMTSDTIEVKTAVIQSSGSIKAYNLDGKEKHCNYVALVDMTRSKNDMRISIIPSSVFFSQGNFNGSKAKNKDKDTFTWSGSYNSTDKIQIQNTQMFLEYEI